MRLKSLSILAPGLLGVLVSPSSVSAQGSDAYDDGEESPSVEEPFRSDAYDDGEEDPQALSPERQREVDPTLSAGGLSAPDAMPEQGDQRTEIEKELDQSDREDAGRGLEFAWTEGYVGYQLLNITGFSHGDLLGAPTKAVSAFSFGGAAGLRILYFTLGARFRYTPTPDFSFWNLGGELGLRVPYGALEPYVQFGLGYAHVGRVEAQNGTRITGVRGLSVKLAGGLDYYFSRTFSIGGQVGFDYLSMHRPAQKNDACAEPSDCVMDKKGSSSGFALSPQLVVGLHF